MTNFCCQCHQVVEDKIGGYFEKLGHLISRHPWKIIIIMILVNGLLGIGIMRMEKDIDVSRVYTPANSQAAQDEAKLLGIFPDKSGSDFYLHQLILYHKSVKVILKPKTGTILDIDFLDQVRAFDSYINSIKGNKSGNEVIYTDICALRNNKCVISGSLFLTDEFRTAAFNNSVSFPYFILRSGEVVSYSRLLSGAVQNNGKLTKATHIKLQYNLRSDSNDYIKMSKVWQEALVEKLTTYTNDEFDFAFSHSDSMSEELNSNIVGDIKLFSLTFTLMITFACLSTYSYRHDCIGNRMQLGLAGVLAAGLSIIASFGLVSACGMSFVSIVGNMPFLILGIGVDAMFILLSGLSDAPFDGDTQSRIGQMMRTSGVAITITSLTDVLAFGAGATSSFKSVRNFCVYTGVAIIFCYLNQLLFFSACITVNENRVKSKRHFISCFKTKSKEEMMTSSSSKCAIFCCAGTAPKSREDVEGYPEKLSRRFLTRLLLLTPVKVIVLLIFAVYLGISIWGAKGLKQGLVVKDLVSEESYYFKFSMWEDEHFNRFIPISFVIDQTYEYSNVHTQTDVDNILSDAKADKFISAHIEVSWLSAYRAALPYYDDSSEAAFVNGLKMFLNNPRFSRFTNDVIISGDSITASRVYVFTNSIDDSQDSAQMMLNMRALASKSPLSVTVYSPPFIFYEQYTAILPQTLQTLGIGVGAVFLITTIFMPHPLLMLYVVINIAMILTGIIGLMTFWNLTLSSITMIHLIMSVGFSVDFTAHMCHAYMVANSDNRNQCVVEAVTTAGGPIFNGAVSSVLGILVLAFAKSYIFMSFFKVMFLVIVLGAAHALFFLPVLLSLSGPRIVQKKHRLSPNFGSSDQTRIDEHSMNETVDLLKIKTPTDREEETNLVLKVTE